MRHCQPGISVQASQIGKVVAVEVSEGMEKPYSCGDGYFRRLNGTTQKMSPKELGFMFRENDPVLLKLSDAEVKQLHKGNRTMLSYRLAWSRYYLKCYGLVDNSSRGIWALTVKGKRTPNVEKGEIVRFVHKMNKQRGAAGKEAVESEAAEPVWKDQLLEHLRKLSPRAFEELCQRVLRESGFIKVEVTGRSGDGGIDGRGIMRMGGLLSFHIIFQCKRYAGSVSSKLMRDFRGAMVGRADKGLLITTGTFTRDAVREATRDGAPPIDLIDGEQLADKMKELRLGVSVKTRTEEVVEVSPAWFKSF